ncbi:nucleotidyltransferase family protein [bacterium]|nr:MAG: nucleotidyltransferase family protein [bacterium]
MESTARDVAIVLLAAGRAQRMGRPKLAATIEGRTLLERALDACRHHPTVVVVGAESEELLRRLGPRAHVTTIVRQPAPERGLASSARLGACAAPRGVALAIVLADRPFLTCEVVDDIIERYRGGDADILYPVVGGVPAHPVVFGPRMRERVERAPDGESLRELRDAPGAVVARVELDDAGALFDVDTEEDLAYARRWAGTAGIAAQQRNAEHDPSRSEA